MTTSSIGSLVIGDTSPAEFQPVIDLVQRHVVADSLRWATDFAAFRQTVASGWWPDLVIVLQAWPDQFSAAEVEELIALCPLARIVCCFGPWCDSDGRTRSLWPLGVRVASAACASRFEHELALLSGSHSVGLPLPLTASRTEIFEFDFDRAPEPARRAVPEVSIISPDRRFREMLSFAFRSAGIPLYESTSTNRPGTIIFDADPWDGQREAALTAIRTAQPQSRLIACVGFARPHVDAELSDAGADGIWFKLAPLADLIDCATAAARCELI